MRITRKEAVQLAKDNRKRIEENMAQEVDRDAGLVVEPYSTVIPRFEGVPDPRLNREFSVTSPRAGVIMLVNKETVWSEKGCTVIEHWKFIKKVEG
jgi:hypothetical protein